MTRPLTLVFDVNETLLSLEPVRAGLEQLFGADPPAGEWFARMLHGSLVANHVGSQRDFAEIGTDALIALAARRGVALAREEARDVVAVMESLPPHPEVYNALERLFDGGFAMVALTNGGSRAANAQIENAGLHIFLRRIFSVEEVGRFKPDPAPYLHVAGALGVEMGSLMMVASHDWDCAGAMAAGADAAFVERSGVTWSLSDASPGLVVPDIARLADNLLA